MRVSEQIPLKVTIFTLPRQPVYFHSLAASLKLFWLSVAGLKSFFLFRMMWTWSYQKLRVDQPHPFPFFQFASPLLSSCSFVVMLFQGILGPPFSLVRLTSKFQFHYLSAQATPKFKTHMSMCSLLNKFTLMLYKSVIILCCPFEFCSC